jgi:hypothetical protein
MIDLDPRSSIELRILVGEFCGNKMLSCARSLNANWRTTGLYNSAVEIAIPFCVEGTSSNFLARRTVGQQSSSLHGNGQHKPNLESSHGLG